MDHMEGFEKHVNEHNCFSLANHNLLSHLQYILDYLATPIAPLSN
jgi:hypothetical protein